MNILFVSAYVPSRIKVRPYSFIKALARRGHAITLVCGSTPADAPVLDELRAVCRRVVAVETGKATLLRNAARALPGELPFQAALSFGPPLLDAVREEARRAFYDVAHIEHLRAAALGYALRRIPTVLDAVDCISLLFERTLRGSASLKSRAMALLDLARTRRYEATYTNQYDQVIVTSPEDAWALQTLADDGRRTVHEGLYATDEERQAAVRRLSAIARTHVIANGVDLNYFAPQRVERHAAKLVFSGKMSYHANVAAALFLGREIMPLVWARRPDVEVAIVGSAPAREVQDLAADPRITVTGYVDDIRPAIAGATMAVAPLRYGVGIQNKVLEAMAMGMPVVAARQVARALQATDGHELVLAQEPTEYAARIVELLDSPARQAAIGAAGRRYVEQHHDWNRAADRLERIYAAAGAQLPPRLDDGLALDLDRMLARTQRQEHAGVMG